MNRNVGIGGLFFLLVLLFSCSGGDSQVKPETIYYGEDTCYRCNMIISDSKFASQYIESSKPAKKFDDIGCMIKTIVEKKVDETNTHFFVVDYMSGKWIDALKAYYVWDKNIVTPMGYGLLAFSTKNKAQRYAEKNSATFIGGYKELKAHLVNKRQ